MNVIIAGSRHFDDYDLLVTTMDNLLDDLHLNIKSISRVFSGTADGADKLGERWASECGILVRKFKPRWQQHGLAAGPIRNAEMAKEAHLCVLFWNGKSRGTKNMLENCLKGGVLVKVVKYARS